MPEQPPQNGDTPPGEALPGHAHPGGTQPGHVWDRMIIGWHVAFWVVLLIAETYVLTAADLRDRRSAASALLGLLAVLYAATVMRSGGRQGGAGTWLYLVTVVAVTGVGCALDPFLSLLLFLVFPQIWLLTSTVAQGVAVTVALVVASSAGFGAYYDWAPSELRAVVPQMAISLAFSVSLGIWISRVIDQSRQRAELLLALDRTKEELAAAHHAQGVMTERERVAREIHDTLAQGFTSVVMLAQAAAGQLAGDPAGVARRLQAIEDVARDNLAEARALVAAFAPPGLAGTTLTGAVRRLADRFAAETGLRVDVQESGPLDELGREREVVLLRTVQEALTNVRRHARARSVVVRLVADDGGARVVVGDDGIGLAPRNVEGFGLAGMRGRVTEAGGELDVASSPGSGTTVTVRLPALVGGG